MCSPRSSDVTIFCLEANLLNDILKTLRTNNVMYSVASGLVMSCSTAVGSANCTVFIAAENVWDHNKLGGALRTPAIEPHGTHYRRRSVGNI